MNDISDLRDTIIPNSDQLNATDLIAGPIIVEIKGVKKKKSKDQPVEIEITGYRPYRPCLTMRRIMIAVWGKDGNEWIGRSMTLFCDDKVTYKGQVTGGIRISHMSDIDVPRDIIVPKSRNEKMKYHIDQLGITKYPQKEFEKNASAWLKAIDQGKLTIEEVVKRASVKGRLTQEQLSFLRGEESWEAIMADIQTAGPDQVDELEARMGACNMPAEIRKDLEAMIEKITKF